MNTATPEFSHVRRPWIAVSLSLLCTGLGQIYCGRAGRGLMMYSASLLFGPVLIVTAYFAGQTPMLVAFLIGVAALVSLLVWSVRDARLLAQSLSKASFEPQEYNRPEVYAMMALGNIPYVLGLAFFLKATSIEAFVIPSRSMSPTFVPGDRVLVTKLGLQNQTLTRGEVVVFRNPIDRRQNYIKRVIGLPGETIEIKKGAVYINGNPLNQTPLNSGIRDAELDRDQGQAFLEQSGDRSYTIQVDHPDIPVDFPPQTIAPDSYFVLGDHRDMSLDSRKVGCVPHGLLVGIVKCIYYPGDSWKRFGGVK